MPDKVSQELWASVAGIETEALEDLIGKLCTGFKSQFLGEDEGVVTIEKQVRDLEHRQEVSSSTNPEKLRRCFGTGKGTFVMAAEWINCRVFS